MYIKNVNIQNFRLFSFDPHFNVDTLNIPNLQNEGSGITAFVGENGCGKSSLLNAIALPLLSYKADSFSLNDFNDPTNNTKIDILSDRNFSVDGTMPRSSFQSKGFSFEAGIRSRGNKSYLSSIVVKDQKYIKADGQEKPKDGSPDLRISVNNPFKGQRFSENEILYLDINRTYQIRTGVYNTTRFDKLMEDFDYQYIKQQEMIQDIDATLKTTVRTNIKNEFLENAIDKFNEISNIDIDIHLIDNWKPFNKGFIAEKKDNNLLVNINMLGSGYETIFSLIYAFYLAQQSRKQLIAFIDEPELHLHPSLQKKFVKFLLEISKESQLILTTQSPLFIKHLLGNEYVKIFIFKKDTDVPTLVRMDKGVLPYVSSNEINYLAFNLATIEYHNELYGYIQEKSEIYRILDFDNWLHSTQGVNLDRDWIKIVNGNPSKPISVSKHTYIRNSIHHPDNRLNENYTNEGLQSSINDMINIISKLT